MTLIGKPGTHYNKTFKLKKQLLRQFLQKRYGSQIADKWQHIFDFTTPVDFTEFCNRVVSELMLRRDVLHQLGFDFYDSNNDDRITEFDAFKVMSYFAGKSYYETVQKDLLTIVKLFECQRDDKDRKYFREKIG